MQNKILKLVDILPLIKYPLLTEKSYKLSDKRKYTFIIDRNLTKKELKFCFEEIFKIKILKINTLTMPIKTKRTGKFLGKKSVYKKAILTLKEGYQINNIYQLT